MSARWLLVALDGMDSVLLERWTADGSLENLAALRRCGVGVQLAAPKGVTDDGLWASFQYAEGLGEHGRYFWWQQLQSGKMGMAFSDEAGRQSFWNALSDEGWRVAVFDIPKCGRPQPLNGIHLADWRVHGHYSQLPRSFPEALASDVVDKFGAPSPRGEQYREFPLSNAAMLSELQTLKRSIAGKLAASQQYLRADNWDVFMVGFSEAHSCSHHLWATNAHSDDQAVGVQSPIYSLYRQLDSAIGELRDSAGHDAELVVFTPTTIVPNATVEHLLPTLQARLNWQLGGPGLASRIFSAQSGSRLQRAILPVLKQLKPPEVCRALHYNENCLALRIVAPNSSPVNTMQLRLDQLESLLAELQVTENSRPAFAGFDRPSSTLPGKRASQLPDLLALLEPGMVPPAVSSPRLGLITAPTPKHRPGNHSNGGYLLSSSIDFSQVAMLEGVGPLLQKAMQA